MPARRLRLLSANIQAGSSTRGYHDYVARSWSHVLPGGNKRGALDSIAELAGRHDIVGLQEADPGSLRSGFTNQTQYLAQRAGFAYWSHQPNRRMGGVASSANGLLSRLEPRLVEEFPLPGRVKGRGVLTATFGHGESALTIAIAHLSLGSQSRATQLGFIAELLAHRSHAVLMGDFNCNPDSPEMQALYRHTQLQPPDRCVLTFPSWRPQRAIDHMLVTPALGISAMQALPAAQSDHLALSVDLDVPETALR
ncbi:endonuclease/exonuclease/phosphatase family protein [Thermomonas paludicola]|uniref:endonuclease/exonuclease/phosphatase family protein n=1 Tax=Thermomonas paludicola TaxID=2884874 RepID=UPI002115B6D3|nr:endonuclease/exonuclease/phosphatase family protein [Thermomonas paludicola]